MKLPHRANIGLLVEDMEDKIRSTLNGIYIERQDGVKGLRSVQTLQTNKNKKLLRASDLAETLKRKQQC